jgi:hypothetical protein
MEKLTVRPDAFFLLYSLIAPHITNLEWGFALASAISRISPPTEFVSYADITSARCELTIIEVNVNQALRFQLAIIHLPNSILNSPSSPP